VELKFGDAFGRDEHLLVRWSPVGLTMRWRQIAARRPGGEPRLRVPISSRSIEAQRSFGPLCDKQAAPANVC
jgi:hypothetical protein